MSLARFEPAVAVFNWPQTVNTLYYTSAVISFINLGLLCIL